MPSRFPFRCHCLVPGCRRTKGVDFDPESWMWEWICATHWKLVSMTYKSRRTKLRRKLHRIMAGALEVADVGRNDGASWFRDPLIEPPKSRWLRYADPRDGSLHLRLARYVSKLWIKMRQQAIERAMGI